MSVKFFDGLDAFGSSGDPVGLANTYTVDTVAGFTVIAGRISGFAFEHDTNIEASRWFESPAAISGDTLVVGCAVWRPAAVLNDRMMIALRDGDGALGMNVRLLTTSELQVRRGTTVLETTSTGGSVLPADSWHYFEFKVLTHASAGSYELRIDGVDVASDTGLDTQQGSSGIHASVRFHSWGGRIDDIYIDDANFLGDKKVVTIFPDAAGDDSDWTPSAGTNHEAVDETPSDGDTTFVADDVTDEQDLYGFPTPSGIGTVVAVQHNVVCRVTDVTPFDIKLVAKSGATESVDSAQAVSSTTYGCKRRIMLVDPDTTVAWTAAGIGAAQFGARVG